MKRRGSASFEHLAAVVLMGVAGLGGLAAVGSRLGADIGAGNTSSATPRPMVRSAEAGLSLPSFLSRGADVGATLVHQVADEAAAFRRAQIVTNTAASAGEIRGVELGLREVVDSNYFETSRALFRDDRTIRPEKTYEYLLGRAFVERLRDLRSGDRWIDMGSGAGGAARDFYEAIRRGRHGFTFDFGSDAPPSVTVVSRTAANTERFATKYPGFSSLYGRFVEDIPARELGKADVISDVFGPLSYSPHLDEVLGVYGRALKPGGNVFAVLRTRTTGSQGEEMLHTPGFLREWLGSASGLRVSSMLPLDLNASAIGVTFERTKGRLYIPELTLLDAKPTTPPTRHYILP